MVYFVEFTFATSGSVTIHIKTWEKSPLVLPALSVTEEDLKEGDRLILPLLTGCQAGLIILAVK